MSKNRSLKQFNCKMAEYQKILARDLNISFLPKNGFSELW